MADEPSFHEEFADADNADSDEIADLRQKISDLEEENRNIIQENRDYLQRIDDLTASVDELSSGLADLKNQTDLEGEISRLHRDLEESRAEFSGLKSKLDGRDEEFEVLKRNVEELDAVARKGDDLAVKMEEEIGALQRCLDEKERVIRELGGGGENGGRRCGVRQREWMLVGGTAIATAAAVICYFHASRKN